MAELDYSTSVYTFANNNPVYFNDPWGLTSQDPNKKTDRVLPPVTVTSSPSSFKQPTKAPANAPAMPANAHQLTVAGVDNSNSNSNAASSPATSNNTGGMQTAYTEGALRQGGQGGGNEPASKPEYAKKGGSSKTLKSNNYDVEKAIQWLNTNAHESWMQAKGQCAKFVRLGIEAGGLSTAGRPVPAWQYRMFLPKLGFQTVTNGRIIRGDIAVIDGYSGATSDPKTGIPYGHIQMFNGFQWISDFKQKDFWPGKGYRTHKPSFQIFRHK